MRWFGAIFFFVGVALYSMQALAPLAFTLCSSFFAMLCLLTVSTSPVDELDMDYEMSSHPGLRNLIGLTCIVASLGSFFAKNVFFGAPLAIPGLLLIFGGRHVYGEHLPPKVFFLRPTTIFSVFVFFFLVPDPAFQLWGTIYYVLLMSLFMMYWLKQQRLYKTGGISKGWHPTLGCWLCCYAANAVRGSFNVAYYGLYGALLKDNVFKPYEVGKGVFWLAPFVLLLWFGRRRVFNFMLRRFDLENLEADGVFLASLFLDSDATKIGGKYWIHYSLLKQCYPLLVNDMPAASSTVTSNHGKHWLPAVVVDQTPDGKRVKVELLHLPGSRVEILRVRKESLEEVLAESEVRCVEWGKLTYEAVCPDLSDMEGVSPVKMKQKMRENYSLSRPLKEGEKIDFFVCHSWRDNATSKWKVLSALAASFTQRTGRYPTFWFDRFCMDSNRCANSLKGLCVYVTSCNSMVALCGVTFPGRLWCAWELFAIMAFHNEEYLMSRLIVLPLDVPISQWGETNAPQSQALESLLRFDIKDAHCYDPNDELRLKSIIECVGLQDFHEKFHRMTAGIISRR